MAAVTDLRSEKIPNQWIVIGYLTGIYVSLSSWGVKGIFIFIFNALWPIILFYFLFYIRALGAGDVKLLSALASIVGMDLAGRVMVAAFLSGAFFSFVRLIRRGQFIQRCVRLKEYAVDCLSSHRLSSYSTEDTPESYLHFSLCILFGYGLLQILEVVC